MTESAPPDPEKLLRAAHQVVTDDFGAEEPLVQAVLHLINCAADAVALLPGGNPDAAREALNCARAAVGVASYAVRRVHDERSERRESR